MNESKLLTSLMSRGSEFLNCEYPIICGAMTWVSDPKLIAAVANNGGFGCLAGGNAPSEILKQQVAEVRALTDKPFGVNLITIAPAYKEHLKSLKELKLEYIVFGQFPARE